MSDQYVGEIRMFSGDYAPQGWAICKGQLLNINEYQVLYTLLGTTYGGDGRTTFGLPDLQSRIPIHAGTNNGTTYVLGQKAGTETVTITTNQLPAHTHIAAANETAADANDPTNQFWAPNTITKHYTTAAPTGTMNANIISTDGGNQAHDNMMPFLVVNYIIALNGLWPSSY